MIATALTFLLAAASAPGPHAVTFVLDMRAAVATKDFDPARDAVGVRGGVAPLSWQETALAADPDHDGRYTLTVTFPRAPYGGQPVAYKFKIEKEGAPREGWEEGRNRQLVLTRSTQEESRRFGSQTKAVPLSRAGTIEVHPAFPSKEVAPRAVQVYLPPGYARERERRYPVLYLHDGQNVFDGAAAGMEWQVDEAVESLVRQGQIEPLIVVAVANTDARTDEYTPTAQEGRGGGKAAVYARFLCQELKPFIDRSYRTLPGPADTAVGGASHGGLVSLWLALTHPGTFGTALALSTSAGWDDARIVKQVQALPAKPPVRIWLDVGLREGEWFVTSNRQLRDALAAKGWTLGEDLRYLEQEEGAHDEISWASRMPAILTFLRPKQRRRS
ncbi:MAG TPA: alpha/beta hydrolase-fold protein [Candidatus Polarisedimenticolaceae bacterium]|nr:alpha/beta hydrolase-fold protein [Candidatus Polarisedimenticolaceae bacterium]